MLPAAVSSRCESLADFRQCSMRRCMLQAECVPGCIYIYIKGEIVEREMRRGIPVLDFDLLALYEDIATQRVYCILCALEGREIHKGDAPASKLDPVNLGVRIEYQ